MTRVIGSSMARIASALIDAVSARVGAERPVDRRGGGGRGPRAGREPRPAASCRCSPTCSSRCGAATSRWRPADACSGATWRTVPAWSSGSPTWSGSPPWPSRSATRSWPRSSTSSSGSPTTWSWPAGGGCVKMIGDEVMFLVDDPVRAAEIALGLAEASRDAAELSDVRVGSGRRPGDRARRAMPSAPRSTWPAGPRPSPTRARWWCRPSCASSSRTAAEFAFRSMRPRFLKHIGRVALSVLRRSRRRAVDDPRGDRRAPPTDARDRPREDRRGGTVAEGDGRTDPLLGRQRLRRADARGGPGR